MPMEIRRQRRGPPSCITPKWKWCPKCGKLNEGYRKFCKSCATPLEPKLTKDGMIGSSDKK